MLMGRVIVMMVAGIVIMMMRGLGIMMICRVGIVMMAGIPVMMMRTCLNMIRRLVGQIQAPLSVCPDPCGYNQNHQDTP